MTASLEHQTTKSLPTKEKSPWRAPVSPELLSELGVSLETWTKERLRAQLAKDRCTNPRSKAFHNYGGRGITFEFAAGSDMAEWVLRNLGPPPVGASLDRVDNDKGYAPGNLRWATRGEQNSNKRKYKRWVYGDRIDQLLAARSDFCYETIRSFIKQGLTDAEILARKRTTSGRPRLRHR